MFNIEPELFLITFLTLVIAIPIHEFAHAISADALGDRLPRSQGRVTLNPLVHFDPIGFILTVLLAAGIFGFAWGKPVMVNPAALRGGRRGMALTAIAGPLSNLIQAAVAVVVYSVLGASSDDSLLLFLRRYIEINLLLAAFNMLPIPPLDGFNVLMGLVSDFWVQRLAPLRTAGAGLLLLLVFVGGRYIYPYTVIPMYQLFERVTGWA